MSLGGVASQGQLGGAQTALRLPSTPQSRQSRDSSPYTGEPRSGTHRQKDSPFSPARGFRLPGCTGEPGA